MLARNLRYNWFQKLSADHAYHHLVTAHHQNDSIETHLYNLFNKTGIKGLTGIPLTNGKIIRPLLTFSKAELEKYAEEHQLNYRIDESNQENKYARNKIRNRLLPIMEEINPKASQNIAESISNLKEVRSIYEYGIQQILDKIVETKADHTSLNLKAIKDYPSPKTILHEFLTPYRFSHTVAENIMASTTIDGQIFESPVAQLTLHKSQLLLYSKKDLMNIKQVDHSKNIWTFNENQFKLEILDWAGNLSIEKDEKFAYIDHDKINHQLYLKLWSDGDRFQPFGLNGQHQKVQDFLSNKGINRICLLYTSPSPRDRTRSRMPSSA